MSLFEYSAATSDGKIKTSQMDAIDRDAVVGIGQPGDALDLHLLRLTPAGDAGNDGG